MKLIALDLDNTLLKQDKSISAYSMQVIEQLRDEGHIVTLATGRAYELTKPYAEQLAIKEPLILNNGALIRDTKGEIYKESKVCFEAIDLMLHYADKHDLGYTFYAPDGFHTNDLKRIKFYEAWNASHPTSIIDIHYHETIKPLLKKDAYKLLIIDNDKTRFNKAYGKYRNQSFAHITKSQTAFLDVLPQNTSKASALKTLAEQLNIPKQDIIAFGDNDNDVEMLSYAHLSFAMPNATTAAKTAANQLAAATCEEDGVAKTLDNLLLKKP